MKSAPLGIGLALLLSGCMSDPKPSANFPIEPLRQFDARDTAYLLYPGDEIDVNVVTAPELSRTLRVAPDGRVQLSLGAPVMAGGRTADEVRQGLEMALSRELLDPSVTVVPTGFASQRIFVGGEVVQPGMFELPGQIDPLQAIIMAGGMTDEARAKQVVLIRRLPDGTVTSAVIDMKAGIYDPALAEWGPLRRFDVIYVPKSMIAQENLFVSQFIRQALPLEFSFFYDLRAQ